MHQSKVVWRANPDISFPYAQQSDEADTIKANGVSQDLSSGISNESAVPLQEPAVAQDNAAQGAELSAAQAAAQAQAQENMARNAAIVSETFAALKSSLLSEQTLSDRTHSQLESEITDNERLANDARAEQFATEQQLAAYAQEQSRAAQAQAQAQPQTLAQAHAQSQAQAQAPSQGYPGQVAPPYAPNQAPGHSYNQAPNQAYNQASSQGFGSQAPNQMGYVPNQSWQAPVQGQMQMAPAAMQAAPAAPAPVAAQSAPVGGAPSRPDADVYVQPDSSITYLENMMRFLNSKGLRVATYHPAWQYQPNDIILMPYAPYPMPSNRTFVMTNDKKAVWNFLKSEFASRGIAL
ncbi:MAG: hypothetical protein SOV16_03650 [Anaerobiospirillum succiniciproducens]|uniref:hypothetical protein n=1 Tax=Anaerobiospirillum succiniciproducens TaxID=13335 RepID=UPI002357DC7A|nr:hypothetical protein [Anaerobiospirillum succiniciproducens]MCI6863379.1 hypothetical protein [Anaerobiospirillum succiniciproducens]MDY2798255.1 hypothetical protein [Anaerobiospirillum succiniciproducens]